MSTIRNFENLVMWQKSRFLCQKIFEIIQTEKFARDYKLKEQIDGSSGSIMDNIAGGFGREGNAEFKSFLCIAKASAFETKSQLYRALDRKYIIAQQFNDLILLVEEICRLIGSSINYLVKSGFKGQKFKQRDNG